LKQEKIDLSQERKILIYMIVSSQFLKEITPAFQSKYFKSSYSRLVSNWIIDHFNQYQEAPGKHIQDIYESRHVTIRNEDDLEMVSGFLKSLSNEWETYQDIGNVSVLVTNAINYFKLQSLNLLQEQLEIAKQKNDPAYGENAIANYGRVEIQKTKPFFLLRDSQKIVDAFNVENDFLFKFPGVVGEVCGIFRKKGFYSFIAGEKMGKTWWLMYTAMIAMSYGLHVIYISLEMDEDQMGRRAWEYLKRKPRETQLVDIPYFEEDEEQDGMFNVKIKQKEIQGIDVQTVEKDQGKFRMYHKTGSIAFLTFPVGSAGLKEVNIEIDNISYFYNFNPQLIVIDYGDNLLPSTRFMNKETRHQLNDIWGGMRGLSQKRECCVFSATQCSKIGYEKDITKSMVPEDKRKSGHVEAMIAINQNQFDEGNSAVRVANLFVREGKRNTRQAYVLQCLDIGNPCIDSKYADQIIKPEEEKKKYSKHKSGKI
jgi:hypothetical protein